MKIKKFTLTSAAILASFALGGVAFADQEAPAPAPAPATPAVTAPEATTTTVTPATEIATPAAETPKVENKATEITKSGDEITVKNPEVKIEQPNGNGLYSPFKVEYKNIKFADDMVINEGDKVIFTLPQEVKLQTSYTFDVFNPEKQ